MMTAEAPTTNRLRAPFPFFGGKGRVADVIWDAFGDVELYVEPFAGSIAVLLARPVEHRRTWEVINDLDPHIVNFWRAAKGDPDGVVAQADGLKSEVDLMARSLWLSSGTGRRRLERLWGDPDFYDLQAAGWWLWVQSLSLGGIGGYAVRGSYTADWEGRLKRTVTGQGVAKRRQELTTRHGIFSKTSDELRDLMQRIAARLVGVDILCGDWSRAIAPSVLRGKQGGNRRDAAVLLDPPYGQDLRSGRLYRVDTDVATAARTWAVGHGEDYRIALCGLDWEHRQLMPGTWRIHEWESGAGGFSSKATGRPKRHEAIWFSPACLPAGGSA